MYWQTKSRRGDRVRFTITAVVVLVGLGLLFTYGLRPFGHSRSKAEPEVDPIEIQVIARAQQWGADAHWRKRLQEGDAYVGQVYSVEMEQVFLAKTEERFAFPVRIEDVSHSVDGKLRVLAVVECGYRPS